MPQCVASPAAPSWGAATAVLTLSTGLASPALAVGTAGAEGQRHHSTDRRAQELTLPDGLRPEGITSGPGSRYYVGSLADGRIVTGDLRTGSSSTLLPGATGRQLRGLYWDHRSNLVWAVGNVGTEAHVWAVDSRTGAVRQDTVVPGASFLNDLVVTRDSVWVADSRVDRLTGPQERPCRRTLAGRPAHGSRHADPGQRRPRHHRR